jgi:hypothetical protein
VIERSFLDAPLDAEVVFAYLSPAVLQRLRPQLELLPATSRVVTAWFDVPSWAPPGQRPAQLHDLARFSTCAPRRWLVLAGMLCALPAAAKLLVTTSLTHPWGAVAIAVDETLADLVTIATGADAVGRDLTTIAIDLVLASRPAGTAVTGTLHTVAAGTCELFCFASTTSPPGSWPINAAHCAQLRAQFAIGQQ